MITDRSTAPHVTLIDGPGVWMEGAATEQLATVSRLPGCVRAVGMPDLHPGRGIPIGAVVATHGAVYPELIGSDGGCGARVMITTVERLNVDRLEKRIREAFATDPFAEVDPTRVAQAAWHDGPRGLLELEGIPEGLCALALREPENDGLGDSGDGSPLFDGLPALLGTIGGGNHFAELSRVSELSDPEACEALALERRRLAVLVHSGSRGVGAAVAKRWSAGPLAPAAVPAYLADVAGACRFARTNRLVLAYRLLSAIGALRDSTLGASFDVTHNDVRREAVAGVDGWVHRKGAAPAYAQSLTVVLGSRGAPSWVMKGTGNEVGLQSVAHGAGRKMGRGEAREKLKARYRRAAIARSPLGGRIVCDDKNLLFEEHPDAYKSIEPIIAAIEAHGLATRVASLVPFVTVKL